MVCVLKVEELSELISSVRRIVPKPVDSSGWIQVEGMKTVPPKTIQAATSHFD